MEHPVPTTEVTADRVGIRKEMLDASRGLASPSRNHAQAS